MNSKYSVLHTLYKQQQFCDVLIRVKDKEFHAHKIILSCCTPYFRALFTRWSTPECDVFDVSDVSSHIMELIMDYAYSDSLTVTEENAMDLFIAADRFLIEDIVQACRDLLEQHLSPRNCISTWRFADMYFQQELTNKTFLFMLTHFEEVVATSDTFRDLSVQELVKIIKHDRINVRDEGIVYEAILQWIDFAPDERQQHLCVLMSKVRWAHLSEEYIQNCVTENEMVKTNHMCQFILLHALHPSCHTLQDPMSRPRLPSAILLAIGGRTNVIADGATRIIQAYNFRADQWVNVNNDKGSPRVFYKSVYLNRFVYCIGGCDNFQRLSSVHRFDPETHVWQEVAPMHAKRGFVCAAVLDGCIYAMGGYDGQNRLETAEVYRPETNQWTEIMSMHQKRSDADSVALNGKVYVIGGFNGYQCLSSAEYYDPQTKEWTLIANMHRSRAGLGVVFYDNKIYAIGGYNGGLNSSVESYDPNSNTWQREPRMLNSRSNFGVSVIDSRIFVLGGYGNTEILSDVECFHTGATRWLPVCDLGIPRSGLSCCVVDGLNNITDYAAPLNTPH